jgi:hypothetical protein
MLNIDKADRMIEALEIMASDNYYPLEDNPKYKELWDMVEDAGFNDINYVDKYEFIKLYNSLKKAIENY